MNKQNKTQQTDARTFNADNAENRNAEPNPNAGQYTARLMKHGIAMRKIEPEIMQYNSQQYGHRLGQHENGPSDPVIVLSFVLFHSSR